MTSGKLLLQAPLGYNPTDQGGVISHLTNLGLVGAHYGDTPVAYLAGPKFLQLITFLGCSPQLQLEPPADGSQNFCHIRLHGPFEKPRLLSAANTRPPRCPACGKGLAQWHQMEPIWRNGNSESKIICQSCGQSASPADLDWRRKAVFGHYFIEICGVFPEEAVPLPALMESLRGEGAPWRYFYLQDW